MKLINDDEEDLFLHDFGRKKKGESDESRQPDDADRPFYPRQPQPVPQEFAFGAAPGAETKKRSRRGCGVLFWFSFILIIALAGAFYIRYYIPHTTESKTRGYVTVVEKRGILFKTFEGELVPETQLADSSHIYSRDFQFSIPDDSLGRLLQSYQGTGTPVTITTKKYYGSLPWRGATNTILTDISEK